MGDRIVVMSEAVVQQIGTPSDVYHSPANLFVANFIGSPGMNLVHGRHADGSVLFPGDNRYLVPERWRPALARLPGDEVIVGFRPEAAAVGDGGQLGAEVYSDDLHGAYTMMHLALDGAEQMVHIRRERSQIYPIGATVRFDIEPEMVRFFDPQTESALSPEVTHG